jgi:hypothetical protein
MAVGTGTTNANKLMIQDGNALFTETRIFEVQGQQMRMTAKGMMAMNGKQEPFEQTVIYRKHV